MYKVVGVHDVINHTKFGFNTFRGFRSTGGQNFRFPIDFAGHRYNSAAATAQPVITHIVILDLFHFYLFNFSYKSITVVLRHTAVFVNMTISDKDKILTKPVDSKLTEETSRKPKALVWKKVGLLAKLNK